jgi:hypothetical protein
MSKIYSVWVSSNASGGGSDHCGYVRAFDEMEALREADLNFSDRIRRSLADQSIKLDHFEVDEWNLIDDDENEPTCVNDPEPRYRTCGRVQSDSAVLECDECD